MRDISERLAKLSPGQRRLLEERLAKLADSAEPIAIVGMACRFPKAATLDDYWRVIIEGIDATGEVPPDRWNVNAFYDPDPDAPGKMYTRWGGFLDGVDQFDPLFFGISPREASRMDPQQRVLLEVAWEALENAGIPADRLAGTATGVFVGIGGTDYSKIPTHFENHFEYIDAHVGTGNALSIAANRISYVLDLRGPSFIVDTACSSALLAVHLAIQSLRLRECHLALAGGVNLILSPEVMIAFSKARMLSPSGKCRPFDAEADGYVRGEGCGIVVLKRLSDALRDGDNIWAILRGSATNQDGRTSGITAPNARSQQEVIRAALTNAGISPREVSYIEAHGTGTPLGDPIEIQGLQPIFRRQSDADGPLFLTSVKANIGHTETASGIAGIIKVALMMRYGQIPGQLHLRELNPNIRLTGTRLVIPREPVVWEVPPGKRIAGVSSYGFGGTNVHVVMQDYVTSVPAQAERDRPAHVFILSAKSSASLQKLAGHFRDFLSKGEDVSLPDICYTVSAGRSHFNHRLAIVATNVEQLSQRLEDFLAGRRNPSIRAAQVRLLGQPKIVFLFTGQGSQYVGMGATLYESSPTFREALNRCDEILKEHLPRRLLSVIYPEKFDGAAGADASLLDETLYTQPALFAIEYALSVLWRSWGIEPDYVLGHSVGEYVAACVAGVFSLEDGLKLIAHRARLMAELPRDGMMAVIFASAEKVRETIRGLESEVAIAAANGPENTVLSGRACVVEELIRRFQTEGIGVHPLTVSHAFHSPLMEPILERFEAVAREITYHPPTVPIVSNVTGEILTSTPDARYWREHIRLPVLFARQVATVMEEKPDIWLELGPAPILLGMARRCVSHWRGVFGPSLRRGHDDWEVLLGTVAELYTAGAQVDWQAFDRDWRRRRLQLPTYPFDRSRFWFEAKTPTRISGGRMVGPVVHPLLGSRILTPLPQGIYEAQVSTRQPAFVRDHKVEGVVVFPAAAFIEMGLAVARELFGPGRHRLENIAIQQALVLPDGVKRTVQVTVSAHSGPEAFIEIFSAPSDGPHGKLDWVLHATAKVVAETKSDKSAPPSKIDLAQLEQGVIDRKTQDEFYRLIAARKLEYGPSFRGIDHLRRRACDAVANLAPPEEVRKEAGDYVIHPAWLDASLHIVAGVVPPEEDGGYSPYTYLPTFVRAIRLWGDLSQAAYTYAIRRSDDERPSPASVDADVLWVDREGQVVLEIEGLRVERLGRRESESPDKDPTRLIYRLAWVPSGELPPEDIGAATSEKPGQAATPWLVIGARSQWCESFADWLTSRNYPVYALLYDNELTSSPTGAGAWERRNLTGLGKLHFMAWTGAKEEVLEALSQVTAEAPGKPVHVVFLSPSFIPENPGHGDRFSQTRRRLLNSFLAVFHALADRPNSVDKFTVLTCGVPWMEGEGDGGDGGVGLRLIGGGNPSCSGLIVSPANDATQQTLEKEDSATIGWLLQATLWGFVRSAALEYPTLSCQLVDVDPVYSPAEMASVVAGEASAREEPQLVIRNRSRFVPRIVPAPELGEKTDTEGLRPPTQGSFRIRLAKTGSFDGLRWESTPRRVPGPGQVEIEVHAAGLNFSDVLKVLGLYPGITDPVVPLGIECSGVVTAVGDGVTGFRVGDEVYGVAPFSFASHALSAEYALVHKPPHLTHAEAATIPITFLTAYYALVHLARLQPGERVLIHAGAGGVGLAAIQIAQYIGAEIFATAGSDRKREFLRNLGVPHVLDSRSTAFADEIRRLTRFEGVDVVLNSLPGEMITASLGVLRAYGRFLEIGKIDIYQNRMIGLAPFKDNLSYFAIDLDRLLRQRPELVRKLLGEIAAHIEAGDYRALPYTEFPAAELPAAFRFMAQRKNIGKIVIRIRGQQPARDLAQSQAAAAATGCWKRGIPQPPPSGDAIPDAVVGMENSNGAEASEPSLGDSGITYLITGGLGALGLQVAQYLVEHGVRFIALLARRAPSDHVLKQIRGLESRGARIAVIRGDVSSQLSLQQAIQSLPQDFPRIGAVIHAAGVLENRWVKDLDEATLEKPILPKVDGTWNLFRCLRQDVRLWVLFSSVAGALGSPGQANYAAGNAFLDAFGLWCRSKGIRSLVVNWGPWADGGMAAGQEVVRGLEARGFRPLAPSIALEALGRLVASGVPQALVVDVVWERLAQALGSRRLPILDQVAKQSPQGEASSSAELDHQLLSQLRESPAAQRPQMLEQYFTRELARIMGLEPGSVDVELPLSALGLDSLMAMELKNNLEARLGLSLPMASFVENPSIRSLAAAAAASLVEQEGDQQKSKSQSDTRWSPIVGLASGPERPPLFCFHPLAGDSRCYLRLAQVLQGRWPTFAVEARGADGRQEPYRDGVEMIADYIRAITERQPTGPYFLAGWSAGGVIALEVARQLRNAGRSLAFLAFIDTPLPSVYENVDLQDEAKFLCDLVEFTSHFSPLPVRLSYEKLKEVPADRVFEVALEEAKRQGALSPETSPLFIRRLCEVGRTNVRFIKNYNLQPIDIEIAMFLPSERGRLMEMSGKELRPDLGWSSVVGQKFRVIEVPGDHFTMLEVPHVEYLAAELLKELEAAWRSASRSDQ